MTDAMSSKDQILLRWVLGLVAAAFLAWAAVVWDASEAVQRSVSDQTSALIGFQATVTARLSGVEQRLASLEGKVNANILPLAEERIEHLRSEIEDVRTRLDQEIKEHSSDRYGHGWTRGIDPPRP